MAYRVVFEGPQTSAAYKARTKQEAERLAQEKKSRYPDKVVRVLTEQEYQEWHEARWGGFEAQQEAQERVSKKREEIREKREKAKELKKEYETKKSKYKSKREEYEAKKGEYEEAKAERERIERRVESIVQRTGGLRPGERQQLQKAVTREKRAAKEAERIAKEVERIAKEAEDIRQKYNKVVEGIKSKQEQFQIMAEGIISQQKQERAERRELREKYYPEAGEVEAFARTAYPYYSPEETEELLEQKFGREFELTTEIKTPERIDEEVRAMAEQRPPGERKGERPYEQVREYQELVSTYKEQGKLEEREGELIFTEQATKAEQEKLITEQREAERARKVLEKEREQEIKSYLTKLEKQGVPEQQLERIEGALKKGQEVQIRFPQAPPTEFVRAAASPWTKVVEEEGVLKIKPKLETFEVEGLDVKRVEEKFKPEEKKLREKAEAAMHLGPLESAARWYEEQFKWLRPERAERFGALSPVVKFGAGAAEPILLAPTGVPRLAKGLAVAPAEVGGFTLKSMERMAREEPLWFGGTLAGMFVLPEAVARGAPRIPRLRAPKLRLSKAKTRFPKPRQMVGPKKPKIIDVSGKEPTLLDYVSPEQLVSSRIMEQQKAAIEQAGVIKPPEWPEKMTSGIKVTEEISPEQIVSSRMLEQQRKATMDVIDVRTAEAKEVFGGKPLWKAKPEPRPDVLADFERMIREELELPRQAKITEAEAKEFGLRLEEPKKGYGWKRAQQERGKRLQEQIEKEQQMQKQSVKSQEQKAIQKPKEEQEPLVIDLRKLERQQKAIQRAALKIRQGVRVKQLLRTEPKPVVRTFGALRGLTEAMAAGAMLQRSRQMQREMQREMELAKIRPIQVQRVRGRQRQELKPIQMEKGAELTRFKPIQVPKSKQVQEPKPLQTPKIKPLQTPKVNPVELPRTPVIQVPGYPSPPPPKLTGFPPLFPPEEEEPPKKPKKKWKPLAWKVYNPVMTLEDLVGENGGFSKVSKDFDKNVKKGLRL